jgi:P pilus assembly chaperone PapD
LGSRLAGLTWALALITAGLAFAPGSASAQLAVDQIELTLTPRVANRSTAVFNVSNEGAQALQATIYLGDWDRDSLGNNQFFPVGSLQRSCRDMVQVFPAQMRLEPHTQQPVRVTLSGADSLRAACWTIVFVEMQQVVPLTQAGRAVQAVLRTGTKVYVEPENLPRDASVEDMGVVPHVPTAEERRNASPADANRRDFRVAFQNSGGMQLRPSGRIEIRRPDNSLVQSIKVDEFPVLPSAVRQLYVPMPTLAPGRYVAIALLDYGGTEIAGGQVEFETH